MLSSRIDVEMIAFLIKHGRYKFCIETSFILLSVLTEMVRKAMKWLGKGSETRGELEVSKMDIIQENKISPGGCMYVNLLYSKTPLIQLVSG